jgi:hypothetical protein
MAVEEYLRSQKTAADLVLAILERCEIACNVVPVRGIFRVEV